MTTLTITGQAELPDPEVMEDGVAPSNAGGSVIEVYQRDTSRAFVFQIHDSGGAGVAGLTPAGRLSIAGTAFIPCLGSVQDRGGGNYDYAPTLDEVSTLGSLTLIFTASTYLPAILQATVVQRYGRR